MQIRNWLCKLSLAISCTCAVAVREGNVVIGLDICDGETWSDTNRVKILQYGNYSTLPSGVKVTRNPAGKHFLVRHCAEMPNDSMNTII